MICLEQTGYFQVLYFACVLVTIHEAGSAAKSRCTGRDAWRWKTYKCVFMKICCVPQQCHIFIVMSEQHCFSVSFILIILYVVSNENWFNKHITRFKQNPVHKGMCYCPHNKVNKKYLTLQTLHCLQSSSKFSLIILYILLHCIASFIMSC